MDPCESWAAPLQSRQWPLCLIEGRRREHTHKHKHKHTHTHTPHPPQHQPSNHTPHTHTHTPTTTQRHTHTHTHTHTQCAGSFTFADIPFFIGLCPRSDFNPAIQCLKLLAIAAAAWTRA